MKKLIRFTERGRRGRWIGLVLIGVLASLFDAGGAVLIFALLTMTSESGSVDIPILGNLDSRFPELAKDQLLIYLAAFSAVYFLIRAGVFLLQTYLQHRTAYDTGVNLSTRLLRGYLSMPYSYHLRRNSAELIRNAQESVDVLVRFVFVPAVGLASDTLLLIGLVAVLAVVAPLATLVALLGIGPLVLILLRAVQPRLASLGAMSQEMEKQSLQSLQQALEGIRDIKVLDRSELFQSRFSRHRTALARSHYLQATLVDVPRVALEAVVVLFILVLFALAITGGSSLTGVVALLGLFAYAVFRVMPAINRVMMNLNYLSFGTAAIDHVYDDLMLVESKRKEVSPDGAEVAMVFDHHITFEDVAYRYDDMREDVLHDVNLSIERGESIGIVGATGGGKTTLVDILLGLLTPTSGTVKVDGVDVAEDVAAWQRHLGMVSQTVFLLDDTLHRNIALGLEDWEIDEDKVAKAVQMAQLEDFVASLADGLDTVVGERGVRLSGGQRQRVAIARALYREPSVLVFDEGTSALDNITEAELIRALERLRGDRTIIIVAHRLTTVRHCDRILMVTDGAIADSGTYDELSERSPEFRRLTRTDSS
jgi:ATP-binding cassette subfamily C protein